MLYSRSLIFIVLLSFAAIGSLSAQPAIKWEKTFGGSQPDVAQSIIQTRDGGYLIAGSTSSSDGDVTKYRGIWPQNDVWVVKISNDGTLEWEKTYGGGGDDNAYSVIQTFDGGYAISGSTSSNNGDILYSHGDYDCWILKINNIGTIEWEKTFGGSGFDQANSIIQTRDSNYIITGITNSNDDDIKGWHFGRLPDPVFNQDTISCFDCFVAKISNTGTLLWEKTLGGSGIDQGSFIIQTLDGGYAIAGSTSSKDGDVKGFHGKTTSDTTDAWVIKLDQTGEIEWQRTLGGSRYDLANSIIQSKNGEYIVSGYTNSNDSDVSGFHSGGYKNQYNDSVYYSDFWILNLSEQGSILWQKCLGGTGDDIASAMIQNPDGNVLIAGSTESNDGDVIGFHSFPGIGFSDAWLVEVDRNGTLLWQKTYGKDSFFENALSISLSPSNEYVLCGSSRPYGEYADFWIAKLFAEKSRMSDLPKVTEKDMFLFPDPNSGLGKINYSLEKSSQVRIEAYDAIGRRVRIISDDYEESGIHERSFDLSEFPSGQYFIYLRSADVTAIKGIRLQK
ncbi:MAG: hypothetical protein ACHQM6_05385 [Candidatus Kapaibacterium sp.]